MVRIVKLARIVKLDKLEATGSIPFRPSGRCENAGTMDFSHPALQKKWGAERGRLTSRWTASQVRSNTGWSVYLVALGATSSQGQVVGQLGDSSRGRSAWSGGDI